MSKDEAVEKLRSTIAKHEERISRLEALIKSEPEASRTTPSIKDFFREKNPQDDLQKTLAVGYYLEKYEGLSSFNVTDIDKSLRDAKEPIPENLNDKMNKNINKKYMMGAKEKKEGKKACGLTAKGETYVESGFAKNK